MSFISVLDNIGSIFQEIFKVAVPIATDIEPVIDAAFPAFGPLYNEAVNLITLAESAFGAAGANKAGAAKLAFVVVNLHPKAVALAESMKIAPPVPAQTKVFAQSVVDGLKAYAKA